MHTPLKRVCKAGLIKHKQCLLNQPNSLGNRERETHRTHRTSESSAARTTDTELFNIAVC